jgi:hypothetical protein
MSGSKKTSQLGVTTTLANTDRVVVLTNPGASAQTQTVTVQNLALKLAANTIPLANASTRGVIRVGYGLNVNANGQLYVKLVSNSSPNTVPATATSNGEIGAIVFDSNYVYICVDNNIWKRAPLSTW